MSESELVRLAGALAALLAVSRILAGLAQRLRQPRVVGEILAGLLLGPTLLGWAWPAAHGLLFPSGGVQAQVLSFVFWLGLLLLMFCSGIEVSLVARPAEVRAAVWMTLVGVPLPMAGGVALALLIDPSPYLGPNGTPASFAVLLGLATAVTAIPVLSRLFFDLGLNDTPLARMALTAAMVEDVILWAVLSVTLGLGADGTGGAAWTLGANIGFFAVFLLVGHRAYAWLAGARWSPVASLPPVTLPLLTLLAGVLAAQALAVHPVFGAFLAGRVVARSGQARDGAVRGISKFSFALLIPIYFAGVGLKVDLAHNLDLASIGVLLVVATALKGSSTWLGARLGGQPGPVARQLAVAMNARGAMGIVLASIALEAGVVNASAHATLVLVALVTTLAAGALLRGAETADTVPASATIAGPA